MISHEILLRFNDEASLEIVAKYEIFSHIKSAFLSSMSL
jgi:hypothetical protein